MKRIVSNYDPLSGKFRRSNSLGIPKEEVIAMYADYQTGMSMSAVGKKHRGVTSNTVREIFTKRGLAVRVSGHIQDRPHAANGPLLPDPPKTEIEIAAMVAALTSFRVPMGLRAEWRHWPMVKRHGFILRLRKKFPSMMPTGKFSAGLTPFRYGTPAAMDLLARLTAGKPSREWPVRLFPASDGVIFRGEFYFWVLNTGYCTGRHPRRALHHLLWEEYNGRPIPEQMTVIHVDGNKNNFVRKNLGLRSMADCARMNQSFLRLARNPNDPRAQAAAQRVSAALSKSHTDRRLARQSDRTSFLLGSFYRNDKTIQALLK